MTKYDFHGTTSDSPEHYTPEKWLSRTKAVMGDIDVDPASCDEAQKLVQAKEYFTEETDGLSHEWYGRIYINPPGDRRGKLVRQFWSKLTLEVMRRHTTEFTWLAFNISQLRTLQHAQKPFLYEDAQAQRLLEACHVCVPYERIHFTGQHPTRDNAFLYYGPHKDQFVEVFRPYGVIYRASRDTIETV